MKSPAGEKLLELQGVFLTVIFGSGHHKLSVSARRTLGVMWSRSPEPAAAVEAVVAVKVEQSLQLLVVASAYAEWVVSSLKKEVADSLKKPSLSALGKLVIGSKTKTEPVVLKVCLASCVLMWPARKIIWR